MLASKQLFWLFEFHRAKTINVSQVLVIHFELFHLVNRNVQGLKHDDATITNIAYLRFLLR